MRGLAVRHKTHGVAATQQDRVIAPGVLADGGSDAIVARFEPAVSCVSFLVSPPTGSIRSGLIRSDVVCLVDFLGMLL